jgi:hypothetical protein
LIGALDRVTRPPVLTVYAALQAGLIVLFAVVFLASRRDPAETPGDPGTGDFVAFYLGGTLIRQGRGEALYDFGVQRELHQVIQGERTDFFQPYLNPPALAVALAPTTVLGYVPSFLLFTLGMVAALAGAALVAGSRLPHIRAAPGGALTTVLLTVGYLPVALTMFGGQNTVLTLFLLAGVFGMLRAGRPLAAGVFLGLLSYKPQYALLPGLVVLLHREWRAVGAAAAVGLLHWAVGAVVAGPAWPLDMLRALGEHAPLELATSGLRQFSLVTAARHAFPGPAGGVVALMLLAAAVALVVSGARRIGAGDPGFPAFFAFVVAATMAISPHLQYYEAGLLPLVGVLALETRLSAGPPRLRERLLLALGYLAFAAYPAGEAFGFQPLVLVLAGVLVWTLRLGRAEVPAARALP